MSLFRPSARASAPDGSTWEIYAYRLRFPKRGPTYDPGLASEDPVVGTALGAEAGLAVLDAILWLLGLIPRLLIRLLWDFPRGGLAALASDSWTVEAVAWYPQHTSLKWATKRAHRREVVAEVARQIADGDLPPRPPNARCLGEEG